MTDLLDRLSDANPVTHCSQPSIEDVWRKLDAAERREPQPQHRSRRSFSARLRWLPVSAGVGVTVVVLLVALFALRPASRDASPGGAHPAWHIVGQGPSLSALMAHFAALRHPATAADRKAAARISKTTAEAPAFVRLLGHADGLPVYLVVDADRRHYARTGPILGYSAYIYPGLSSTEENLSRYLKGDYTIFPDMITVSSERPAYLSVVPDGVRRVRWRFVCATGSSGTGCLLPDHRHTIDLPVRDNLAVLPLGRVNAGTTWAGPTVVTWYDADGTTRTFTNLGSAVPFAGAPAYPAEARALAGFPHHYAPGNGRRAGRPLAYWQSHYAVLRRPQNARDRAVNAKAKMVIGGPFVPGLTRVLGDLHHDPLFIALGLVNPDAPLADRRYVAQFADPGILGVVTSLTPAIGGPLSTGEALSLHYSVVPDGVTKVVWRFGCSGCTQRETVTLIPHGNLVDADVESPRDESFGIEQVDWYVRGRSTPLELRYGS